MTRNVPGPRLLILKRTWIKIKSKCFKIFKIFVSYASHTQVVYTTKIVVKTSNIKNINQCVQLCL